MKLKVLLLFWVMQLVAAMCTGYAQMSTAIQEAVVYPPEDHSTVTDSTILFTIKDIIITGNRQTRPNIILREVAFKKGDRLPLNKLVGKFADTKRQLINSGLFRDVVVSLQSLQGLDAFVHIDVKERWYIYPIPFFRTVDRTFGEWVRDQHMDLRRVNYGIKIADNNITGRNDKLYVNLMNGYTKQLALTYQGLYLDNRLKWSANFGASFGKNRELNYTTINNKLVALKVTNEYIHSFFNTFLEFSYRPAINTRHSFGISYNYENIADTVFKLNPSFTNGKKAIHYPEFTYRLDYFNTDFNPYPTKGKVAQIVASKKGINQNMNLWQLVAKGSEYWPLSDKYLFNISAVGGIKAPFKQPYITQQFIGYNDLFLQGYEYYVIDGVAGGYTKATLSREILKTAFRVPEDPRLKKMRTFGTVPLRIYAKVYSDVGYI